jgi:macrolide transport system ATP-binding/permease protein
MSLVLNADRISKSYGDRVIFKDLSLKIYSGDRIGITGPNGAGKTTLLKVLAGHIKPDEGSVKLYTTVSFLRQQDDGVPEVDSLSDFRDVDRRMAGFLGFDPDDLHDGLSGGERAKARFVRAFDPSCGLLIADEPTSNLDMESVQIVKSALERFTGTLLLVSHDRDLLDSVCRTIIEVIDGEARIYPGNYSDYVSQRDARRQRQAFEYEAYVDERERIANRIRERVEHMRSVRKAPSRMGNSEARLHKRGSTGVQKKLNQSIDQLESRLERLERKEKPKDLPQVSIRIEAYEPPISPRVVRAAGLNVKFGRKVIFSDASFEITTGKRTAILGKNGSGKTTLAKIIANRDPKLTIAPGAEFGYFMQDFSILDGNRSILENVMDSGVKKEHEARGILARLMISADGVHKKVSLISGGEKVKVSIAKLLCSRCNVIILDEPTNYLDVFSMEALERVLSDYAGTLILISHDKSFVANIAERLLIIEDKRIRTFEGTLKEYEEGTERKKNAGNSPNGLEETILRMRLAELSARIGSCTDEMKKQELEEQYLDLVRSMN